MLYPNPSRFKDFAMRLKGKVSIITGGASGIGKATVLKFAQEGAIVAVCDLNQETIDATVNEVKAAGGEAVGYIVNVTNKSQINDMVADVKARFGRIDVLVNNAGVVHAGIGEMLNDTNFDAMMATNVGGVRNMVLAALPALRRSRGNVVNVTSVSGMRGDWGMYGYNASKGAVSLMTQGLALDLGKEGIRVNAVAPAAANTRLAAALRHAPRVGTALRRRIPLGRIAEPDEVASVIAFLAGPDAGFVNGVILPVDGGLSASNGQPDFTDW